MMMRQFDKVLQQRSPAPAIAVAGASTDPLKYGFLVTKFLSAQGYTVWPINSQATTALGLDSYPNVESLPGTPDILCTVTLRPNPCASSTKHAAYDVSGFGSSQGVITLQCFDMRPCQVC